MNGNWRQEQLFNLRVAWEHYGFLVKQLTQCDEQVEKTLTKFETFQKGQELKNTQRRSKNQPTFNVRNYLFQIFGIDVTAIDGFNRTTALTVFSDAGLDYI